MNVCHQPKDLFDNTYINKYYRIVLNGRGVGETFFIVSKSRYAVRYIWMVHICCVLQYYVTIFIISKLPVDKIAELVIKMREQPACRLPNGSEPRLNVSTLSS